MPNKKRILLIDDIHPIFDEMLKSHHYAIEHLENGDYNCIIDKIPEYHGLVLRSKISVDSTFIDKAVSLKFIARAGAGLDLIDVDYAQSKGIKIIHAAEGNRDALAEHCLGLILSLLHRLHKSDREMRDNTWLRKPNTGEELSNKTVGIYGFGNMGSAVAERLIPFGCKVIAYDKYKIVKDKNIRNVSQRDFFKESDIVSLHIPLSAETRMLVNHKFIQQFEKRIYLLNTSRGEVLDLNDLIVNLEKGKVLGAALDVFENENPETWTKKEEETMQKLMKQENTIFTPHVAGWSIESYYKIAKVLAEKIIETNK